MSVWLLLCHQDKTLKEFYEAIEHLKKSDHVKLAQGKVSNNGSVPFNSPRDVSR